MSSTSGVADLFFPFAPAPTVALAPTPDCRLAGVGFDGPASLGPVAAFDGVGKVSPLAGRGEGRASDGRDGPAVGSARVDMSSKMVAEK